MTIKAVIALRACPSVLAYPSSVVRRSKLGDYPKVDLVSSRFDGTAHARSTFFQFHKKSLYLRQEGIFVFVFLYFKHFCVSLCFFFYAEKYVHVV